MDAGYLSQQVTTIINQLHGYFDEIGVPSHERDSRESELFAALSETLHNQLKLVAAEKHEKTEEAQRLIRSIRQMESSLDDTKAYEEHDPHYDHNHSHADLEVTYPLLSCIQALKEKHHTISKIHRERFEQVKKLAEALDSYASHLEPSFVSIKLPPSSPNAAFDISTTYVSKLDSEFSRVYEEYNKRVAIVQNTAEEMIMLWGELGTPQAQVDSLIVQNAQNAPEQLGLHQDDLKRLKARRDRLVEEKQARERRLNELRVTVDGLWEKLGVEDAERKTFLVNNRGCGLRTINEFEDELARLNELKRQNLHLFVEDARVRLQELWDNLYFSEEEMLEFTPAFSDVYSDALLSAHESEIARLEALKEQRAPILAIVDKHRSLIQDRDDLAASSQDSSRLMAKGQKGEKRDPTRLLREEKMRKRIAKDLPKIEIDLRKMLENWEQEYGRPFLVHGERYLDELASAAARATPARSKTPVNAPSALQPKSATRSATASRHGTIRGPPPPVRSKTPTATSMRNPLSASVMGRPPSAASNAFGASVASHCRTNSANSPSKIPSRMPLANMPHGNNSPERRPKSAAAAHSAKEDLRGTVKGSMGPPRVPLKLMDVYVPPTPTPSHPRDADNERSASVLRHRDADDVYDDSQSRTYQSHSTLSNYSMTPSSVSHYPTPSARPASRFDYPSAPPPLLSRQTSNTSSVMSSNSGVSGSENWETYTDASEDNFEPEPDARDAYYAKVRAAKRGSPVDGCDGAMQNAGMGKKIRGYGLGINNGGGAVRAVGHPQAGTVKGASCSESGQNGWSDMGETF